MTTLSDTQLVILSAAAQRPGRIALPLPESLRGGAAKKVVGALVRKGYLAEVPAGRTPGTLVWDETDDGGFITLVATVDGLAAIGIEPEGADAADADARPTRRRRAPRAPEPAPRRRTPVRTRARLRATRWRTPPRPRRRRSAPARAGDAHPRPRYACRRCSGTVVQAHAPEHIVPGGLPTEALIAHVIVAKFGDHLPFYRQAGIYARQGIRLDRATLGNWAGRACFHLQPVARHMREHLAAGGAPLHGRDHRPGARARPATNEEGLLLGHRQRRPRPWRRRPADRAVPRCSRPWRRPCG